MSETFLRLFYVADATHKKSLIFIAKNLGHIFCYSLYLDDHHADKGTPRLIYDFLDCHFVKTSFEYFTTNEHLLEVIILVQNVCK